MDVPANGLRTYKLQNPELKIDNSQKLKVSLNPQGKDLYLIINLESKFNLNNHLYNYLIEKKAAGSIVNIGSIVGNNGFSELTGYASTKTALIGLTKSFATTIKERKNFRRWQ